MKKMLVSDYDKTFYLNDEDIKENIKWVEEFRKQGNIFVFGTGRLYFDYKNKVLEYDLKYDYVLIDHGATILDNKDNILSICYIDNDIAGIIKNDLRLNDSINSFCCSEFKSRVYYDHKNLTKMQIAYYDSKIADYINKKINEKYNDYVVSYKVNKDTIEIISNKISKAKAIDILINKIGLENDDVYTIGEGYSDIEMFEKYNGYCMTDSVDELKKVSNNEYNSVSDLISDIYKQNLKC